MLFFALGQADFQFDPSTQEVQIKWHQGITGALHLADQPADFALMQQQLAGADRVVRVVGGCGGQGRDVHADEEQLATLDDDVGFLDVHPPGADGLDFPAFEDDAGLVFFLDEVIVKGFFVDGDTHAGAQFP